MKTTERDRMELQWSWSLNAICGYAASLILIANSKFFKDDSKV